MSFHPPPGEHQLPWLQTERRPSWTAPTDAQPSAAWLLQLPWQEEGTHSPATLQDTEALPLRSLPLTGSFPRLRETMLVSGHSVRLRPGP